MSEEKKTRAFHMAPEWVMVETEGPSISCWRCGEKELLKIPRPAAEIYRLMDRFVGVHRHCN